MSAILRELIESFVPTVAYAEEPEEEESEDAPEESSEGGDDDEEEEEEDEDDEDEEEEAEDQLDKLKKECAETKACAHYVHHYADCVARVTAAQEAPDYEEQTHKEDCVEEFFHLEHCINDCAAPKLFYKLK